MKVLANNLFMKQLILIIGFLLICGCGQSKHDFKDISEDGKWQYQRKWIGLDKCIITKKEIKQVE